MRLYTFLHAEANRSIEINIRELKFQTVSQNIQVADTVDPNMDSLCYGMDLKVLRIKSRKNIITVAFRYFAGVYESNAEVSVYLCRDESYARVYRTIRFSKEDNKVTSHFSIEYV